MEPIGEERDEVTNHRQEEKVENKRIERIDEVVQLPIQVRVEI